MPFAVEMPKLGLTMEEGTVADWLKAVGDTVAQGEPLFLLETDKITLESEAPESGVLGQILVEAGTTVPTGTPVALILLAGEEMEEPPAPEEEPEAAPPAPPSAKVKATPVARRRAEQAGLDLSAIAGTGPGGRVTSKDVEAAKTQQAPGSVEASGSMEVAQTREAKPAAPPAAAPLPPPPPETVGPKVKASPRAKEMAQKAGLDLASVGGTGKDGRVMVSDVERAMAAGAKSPKPPTAAPPFRPSAPAPAAVAPSKADPEVIPLTGVRGVIARRMAASVHTAASVTTTTQADATELVRLRDDLRQEWTPSLGFAPSYNDLLLVILAKALGEYPYVNSHIVDDEIRQMAEVNIGLAVDTERGLIVPVVRGLQGKLLVDVARATRELVERAREGKLLPDDVSGGTFTLSNMGAFDVEASTPILNLPEVAILGLGRIAQRPAAFEGELCLRQTVTLSLTYDHRAIDGAPAARFLERVKKLVERPHLALVR
jgi:pyruvate dehydrogenase E2 component (dihydrolipoamide acetyltransferase)